MNIRYVDSQLNSKRRFPFILPFLIDRETGSNRRSVKISVEVTRGHFRWIPASSEHAQSIHMAKVAGVYATRTVYTQLAMATPPSFISKQYSTNVIFDVCLDEKKAAGIELGGAKMQRGMASLHSFCKWCVKTTIIMLRNLTQLAPFALLPCLATRNAIAQKLVPFVQTR